MGALEDLTRNYRTAFLRYLPRREEVALTSGYALGRAAVSDGVSILELVRVHHDVLLEVLRDSSHDELPAVANAASEFLLEVLATFHMTQQAFHEETSSG